VRVRRPRSGPLLRRRDGAGRPDHRRAGRPRRAQPGRGRGRAVRRAPRRPGWRARAAGRDGEVPGRPAGERPGRSGPGRTAETSGPGHARGLRRVARPRRGQPVRRRGGVRAPAGTRPGLPAARHPPAARGLVRGPGVRSAGTTGRAGGVRSQDAGRAAARRPGRPRADLRPGAGHGQLGGRAGEQQALAARWAAVRDRGGRTGPLAARRMAACPPGRGEHPGRHHRAAAGAGPPRPRHRAAARAVGGDGRQRPGGPGRYAGTGHARARSRAAPCPRRRQERTGPGDTHPVR
jgi:hypothetical protein